MKSIKLLSIILMMLAIMLIIAGCGKSGARLGNQAPAIQITSFEGWDDTYAANGYPTNIVYSFQQRIYWHAWDKDGVIKGYAFRILDANGDPIATPGYDYIASASDNLIPQNLLDIDPKGGWVIHYMPDLDVAEQSKPLDDPTARRTIWTSQKYAVINFPAADVNGEPIQRASRFEVVAIDNRGAITTIAAWRNFTTSSPRPSCTISTTKGNPDGAVVGAGIKLSFSMDDKDPFIPVIPFRFQFQVMKTTLDGLTVLTPPESLVWVDTKTQTVAIGEIAIINEFLLNLKSNPPLKYDFDAAGIPTSMTRVIARATDMAGVVSTPDTNTVINFQVKKGFSPKSLIYGKKTYALGNYHYEDWGDDTTSEVLPTQIVEGSYRWATPLFRDLEGKYTAVHSNNLKLWVRWGWFGEYATVSNSGSMTYDENNPYGKRVNVVLDRTTGQNYFSEVTYFHIRYDNDYYKFPPYDHLKFQDANGDWWLRVPVTSVIGQSILLTGLPIPSATEPGEHKFQIACEDLQGVVDPIPAEFTFFLHRYNPPTSRDGVLIVDDDINHNSYSPQTTVQTIYEALFADYAGTKRFVSQTQPAIFPALPVQLDTYTDVRGRQLAPSDLQKYKLVVYHNDNPNSMGRIVDDVDALTLYMLNGGNMVVSNTNQLKSALEQLSPTGRRSTLINLMGFPDAPAVFSNLGNSVNNNPFFYKAVGTAGFADVSLNITDSFLSLINSRYHGMGSIAYFNGSFGDTIFKLGSKTVGMDSYSPTTDAQFNTYNDKPVGVRYANLSGGKAYTLGFPFSYMVVSEAKAMINTILSECDL